MYLAPKVFVQIREITRFLPKSSLKNVGWNPERVEKLHPQTATQYIKYVIWGQHLIWCGPISNYDNFNSA